MTTLHFVFTPYLWFSDDDGDFIKEAQYPTGNNKVDLDAKKFISSDKFDYLSDNFLYPYNLINHYFEDNLMHIIVKAKKNLSLEELSDKLFEIDVEGYAPDLWMEGDISINDNIEFVPRIYKLYLLSGNIEEEIDLAAIPKSGLYIS